MEIKKIAILDRAVEREIKESNIATIRQAFPDVEVILCYSAKELIEKGGSDIDVLITWSVAGVFNDELVDFCRNAKKLKWIQSVITGMDGLLRTDVANMGFTLTATRGIHGYPMADHVLAYIFSFLRAFPDMYRFQQKHDFNLLAGELCDESYNKTVGIVGLGMIGQYIAKKCKALDFRVLGLKRHPIECEWVDRCYTNSELDQLLQQSDFVVLTVPLTKDTQDLIGEREFRQMKKSAYLINIARGGVVDTDALIQALKDKTIAGAGLDAFVQEPLPSDSELWDLPNAIITPHLAAKSPYYMERAFKVIVENMQRYVKGEPLLYQVNR